MSTLNDTKTADCAFSLLPLQIVRIGRLSPSGRPASLQFDVLLLPLLILLNLMLESLPLFDEPTLLDFVKLGDLAELLVEDIEEGLSVEWLGVCRKEGGRFKIGVSAGRRRGRCWGGNSLFQGFVAGKSEGEE